MTGSAIQSYAQLYTLKVSQFDSLIWMAHKSKACDTALNFALQTIEAKNSLIHGQGKIIELRGSQIATLQELDGNWSSRMQNAQDLYFLDKSILKAKIKRKNKTILGLSGISLILLLGLVL